MMTSAPLCEPETSPCSAGADLFAEAERELAAFMSAVIQVYGPQYAAKAAEHWMRALYDAHFPNVASKKCFRSVTVSAIASLCQCGTMQVCDEQRQSRGEAPEKLEARAILASLSALVGILDIRYCNGSVS
jgi:hypothetical protein